MIDLFVGKVLWYDTTGRDGVLEDCDGNRYEFNSDALVGLESVVKGQIIMFHPVVSQGMYLADHVQGS